MGRRHRSDLGCALSQCAGNIEFRMRKMRQIRSCSSDVIACERSLPASSAGFGNILERAHSNAGRRRISFLF